VNLSEFPVDNPACRIEIALIERSVTVEEG